jgi:hypothetical protein
MKKNMNRTFVVSLLQKSIKELSMITDGFMEMSVYPKAIIQLSQQKIDDIQEYISQLAEISEREISPVIPENIQLHETVNTDFEKKEQENEIPASKDSVTVEECILSDTTITAKTESNIQAIINDVIEIGDEETYSKTVTTAEKNNAPKTSIDKKFIDDSIATALSNKKISDIKQAISIGDRFRFQRELFNGNGEIMSKTLSEINQCENLDEALKYLASKFNWNEEDETVEDFHQLLKRRF